jgi:dTDP-4-amino-4,6-dideoxygalactose transaminase
VPIHLQDAYAGKIIIGDLKVTEKIMSEIVSLPIYSQLALEDVA